MSSSRSFHLLLALAITGYLGLSASAGVMRHDVSPTEYLDLAGQFPSVGQIAGAFTVPGDPDPRLLIASGVLIAPKWVLTAGHNVQPLPSSADPPDTVPVLEALLFDIDGFTFVDGVEQADDNVFARRWHPHPEWRRLVQEGRLPGESFGEFEERLVLAGYDIGLFQLEEPITHVTPAKRYTGTDELKKVGTSVGFGMIGDGLTGAMAFPIISTDSLLVWLKFAGQNVIDTLLPTSDGEPRIFESDFDNPDDPGDSSMGSPLPLDLEYLTAVGDSGGGVFIQNDKGQTVLAGIHSFGDPVLDGILDSDYGDVSGHIRVSAFNGWINDVIPEPGSFIVWSLLAAVGITAAWSRRRRTPAGSDKRGP